MLEEFLTSLIRTFIIREEMETIEFAICGEVCSNGVIEVTHFRADGRNDNNRSTIINTFILNLNKSTSDSSQNY